MEISQEDGLEFVISALRSGKRVSGEIYDSLKQWNQTNIP